MPFGQYYAAGSYFPFGICGDFEGANEQRNKVSPAGGAPAKTVLLDEGLKWYRKQNYQQAIPWIKKAAEQGDKNAQLYMGKMCYYGLGTKQNYTEATEWFRQSARQGNAEAQSRLGGMYYSGEGGVRVDWEGIITAVPSSFHTSRPSCSSQARVYVVRRSGRRKK